MARSLVGIVYRHQGRSAVSGVDCIGVPLVVATALGITKFDITNYGRRPDVIAFKRAMLDWGCRPVPYGERASGDVLQMSFPRWPVHCGVVDLGADGVEWLVHSMASRRKVVREQLSQLRDAQVSCAWRFPDG